jgi:hypothetical protein
MHFSNCFKQLNTLSDVGPSGSRSAGLIGVGGDRGFVFQGDEDEECRLQVTGGTRRRTTRRGGSPRSLWMHSTETTR